MITEYFLIASLTLLVLTMMLFMTNVYEIIKLSEKASDFLEKLLCIGATVSLILFVILIIEQIFGF